MAIQAAPTKGNLINTKKSLELAEVGYELLDKKRNILIREMMTLIDFSVLISLSAFVRKLQTASRLTTR